MALDWIKWIDGLERRRQVMSMAQAIRPTGIFSHDCDLIAVGWMRVWNWAGKQTLDGHIPGVNVEVVDAVAGFPGFAAAAENVKWLSVKTGGISFPDWAKHNSESEKKRADATERQRRKRLSDKDKAADDAEVCHKNVTGVRDMSRGREEKRRVETKPPPPPKGGEVVFPQPLQTEAFKSAWEGWLEHQRERRSKVTPRTAEQQLKALAAIGEQRAIVCIQRSIQQGWIGLFPDSVPADAKPREAPKSRPLDENATAAKQWLQEQSHAVRERVVQEYRSRSGGSLASTEDILRVMSPALVALVNAWRQKEVA